MKSGFRATLNLSIIISLLYITGCTQQSESTGKNTQTDQVNNTATKNPADTVTEHPQPLTNIAALQKAYSDIVSKAKAGHLDSTAFKYSCNGETGGTVSYYTEKSKLRLVVHRYHEYDHYSAEDRYFVQDSTLFFILSHSVTWAFESGTEGTTKDNVKEKRIYLVKGKPIKCLEKNFVIRSQAKNNPNAETVPSHEVDCAVPEKVMKPYLLLTRYRNHPTSGCLK